MRKLLFIIIWFLFVDAGSKTEWYVEFYSNENEVHKVARDQYLEMKEFFSINEQEIDDQKRKEKWIKDYKSYLKWEHQTRLIEQKRIKDLIIK